MRTADRSPTTRAAALSPAPPGTWAWEHWFGLAGLVLLVAGVYVGLFVAPTERFMGEVYRILYVHVPLQWNALLCFFGAGFVGAASLWKRKDWIDGMLVGVIEVGVVLETAGLLSGIVWAKPTWGVYWAWDPRLTFTFVMWLTFLGVLALRRLAEEHRRAPWTAAASIVASVNAPLVYYSVNWWRSIHQMQSSPETVHTTMILPLRMNAIALLLVCVWFVARRARISLARREAEAIPAPARIAPVLEGA